MWAEDLKGWLRDASRKNKPIKHRWRLMVRLIHRTFEDGVVPEEVAWATMVLLLKVKGKYRGIGLVEVVWKVCAAVANFRLKRSVKVHKIMYGFRAGRGTGIAKLEVKLAQKLTGIAHEPLFQVFLDVRKVYDSMYRGQCMVIMQEYGMVHNSLRLISHH